MPERRRLIGHGQVALDRRWLVRSLRAGLARLETEGLELAVPRSSPTAPTGRLYLGGALRVRSIVGMPSRR